MMVAARRKLKLWLKSEFVQESVSALISLYLRFVFRTSQWTLLGLDRVDALVNKDACIACIWHGRIAMLPFMWHWPHKKAVALVSGHSDGMVVARTLNRLDIDYIFSKTNGQRNHAFEAMLDVLNQQRVVVIIPDGPRGPAKKLKEGIIHLAKRSGYPVVPLAYACSRFMTFNSWDRFKLPLPLSKGVFIYGNPIFIPKESGAEEIETYRLQVERAITDLEQEADQCLKS